MGLGWAKTLKEVVDEWNNIEKLRDEITEETRKVLRRAGQATTDLVRKVLRDGMDTRGINRIEEIYKYNDYIIMDASWG